MCSLNIAKENPTGSLQLAPSLGFLLTRTRTPKEKVEKNYHSQNNCTNEILFRVHLTTSFLNSLVKPLVHYLTSLREIHRDLSHWVHLIRGPARANNLCGG